MVVRVEWVVDLERRVICCVEMINAEVLDKLCT
jgi:hypothetical protein